jgi:hypothetical protein
MFISADFVLPQTALASYAVGMRDGSSPIFNGLIFVMGEKLAKFLIFLTK